MGYLLIIPLGIILGFFIYKIRLVSQRLGYLFGIFPYSILFWLSGDNQEFWGHYRAAAFLATIIATVICILIERKMKVTNLK
jgi:hypothetical protein